MKTLAALLALSLELSALSFALAAVKNPDTLVNATIGDIDSLDPAWAYDTTSHHIQQNLYEFLLAYKGGSVKDLEPRLAEKVPSVANGLISKDGLTYAFPVRKGVKFHDGTEMTPEDVGYSLLRFMLMDRDGGPASLLLEPILGLQTTRGKDGKLLRDIYARAAAAVQVKGDAVVIRLQAPFAPFLTILAQWGAVASKPWAAAHGDWDGTEAALTAFNNPSKREDLYLSDHENGTGPFVLERRDKRSSEIVLRRFDDYWRGPARLQRVLIKKIEEFNTRKLMLMNGDADVVYAPQLMFDQMKGLPGVELIDGLQMMEAPTSLNFTFKINPVANPYIGSGKLDGRGLPPDFFTDPDVRRAFSHVVDFDGFIRDVRHGKSVQPAGFIPKGLAGYDPGKPKNVFDLKRAETRFRKARGGQVWDKGFQFTYIYTTGSAPGQILGSMLKKNLESLNPRFKVDVRPMQWSTYLSETQAHRIPLETAGWVADFPDPHNFAFPLMHSKGYYATKTLYSNPEADRIVEQAARSLDPAERERLYRRLQAIVDEDLPFVLIDIGVRYRCQRTWVKGYVFNPIFPDAPYGSYYYDLYKED